MRTRGFAADREGDAPAGRLGARRPPPRPSGRPARERPRPAPGQRRVRGGRIARLARSRGDPLAVTRVRGPLRLRDGRRQRDPLAPAAKLAAARGGVRLRAGRRRPRLRLPRRPGRRRTPRWTCPASAASTWIGRASTGSSAVATAPALIYSGPNGLSGWDEPNPKGSWREESGQPLTDRPGAMLRGDLELPAKAVVEFELSWKTKADFVLGLRGRRGERVAGPPSGSRSGTGSSSSPARPTRPRPTSPPCGRSRDGPGRVHLLAYLDQEAGRILVVAPDGKVLADLTVPPDGPGKASPAGRRPASQRAATSGWNASASAAGTAPRRPGRDGQIPRPPRRRHDRLRRSRAVRRRDQGVRPARRGGRVARLGRQDRRRLPVRPRRRPRPRVVRAVYSDGTRLGGDLRKVEAGALALAVPGVREVPRLPIDGLRSLVVLHPEAPPKATRGSPASWSSRACDCPAAWPTAAKGRRRRPPLAARRQRRHRPDPARGLGPDRLQGAEARARADGPASQLRRETASAPSSGGRRPARRRRPEGRGGPPAPCTCAPAT